MIAACCYKGETCINDKIIKVVDQDFSSILNKKEKDCIRNKKFKEITDNFRFRSRPHSFREAFTVSRYLPIDKPFSISGPLRAFSGAYHSISSCSSCSVHPALLGGPSY